MGMRLYNSLTRKREEFKPIKKGEAGIYACGPTVYDFLQIGNWRTYVLGDLLVRSLKYLGFETKYVMNITDVGHLVSDGDEGEDKLEKGAKREGETAWDVAEKYTKDFKQGMHKMGLLKPDVLAKATGHIKEQIDLVEKLEKKGFAYKTSDGVYFNTTEFEKQGNKYGELSTLDEIKEGARVEINKEKKDKRDFALWKFSPEGEKRDMEWESPWGVGFPGWHIECSAMSMKYLGEQFDLHVGGEDLRSTHHPNEIAQSEGATGKKPFVKYWIHGAFLLVDGGRMGKSLGNAYTLQDLDNKGFSPFDLKYFYLIGHYRKQLNFTWEALEGAKTALERLRKRMADLQGETLKVDGVWEEKFRERLEDDLDMPGALALVWEMVKDKDLSDGEKLGLIEKWDEVLGLGLSKVEMKLEIPEEVVKLVEKRSRLREEGKWNGADSIREEIEKLGYVVEDKGGRTLVRKR
ncbi:cysteine--tRNA ligase [Patescibacteria group bacterium]|nr:cysteine--tRNA ligase [Patescibacteria group bacterium]